MTMTRHTRGINCWRLVDSVLDTQPEQLMLHTLLHGPPGTGKTHAARLTGLRPGQPVISVALTDETPAAEQRGHFVSVDGDFKYLMGPCLRAWCLGARLVIDELEKSSGDLQAFLLALLDDRAVASFRLPSGRVIRPKPGFHVVATTNGDPDDLDPALRDRFPICIAIDRYHPAALAGLSPDVRTAAENCDLMGDPRRRVSVRCWRAFDHLRTLWQDEVLAALAVFGSRADDILGALRVARASLTEPGLSG